MGLPTSVSQRVPQVYKSLSGTNIDAGNFDINIDRSEVEFDKGIGIQTGTLTAMTVTILAKSPTGVVSDLTPELCGVSSLASNDYYDLDVLLPFQSIVIRCTRSNAVNALAVEVFVPSR